MLDAQPATVYPDIPDDPSSLDLVGTSLHLFSDHCFVDNCRCRDEIWPDMSTKKSVLDDSTRAHCSGWFCASWFGGGGGGGCFTFTFFWGGAFCCIGCENHSNRRFQIILTDDWRIRDKLYYVPICEHKSISQVLSLSALNKSWLLSTVEPRYNEVLGTMKITLLYQVSHYIRVQKLKYKELGPAKLPC